MAKPSLLKVGASLLALALVTTVLAPAHAANLTVIHLVDASGAGVPGVQINVASNAGTRLTKATDTTGLARFPGLIGPGSLEINHCDLSIESIALQIYDADFGDGGQMFVLKLPARPSIYEYSVASENGATYKKAEQLSFDVTTLTVESYMGDYGEVQTPLGLGSISSCGSAWQSGDSLKVAPFASSSEDPVVNVIQQVEGGEVTTKFPTSQMSMNSKSTLYVGPVDYIKPGKTTFTGLEGKPFVVNSTLVQHELSQGVAVGERFEMTCADPQDYFMGLRSTQNRIASNNLISFSFKILKTGTYRCGIYSTSHSIKSEPFEVKITGAPVSSSNLKRKFKRCSDLNKVFKGGIAKSAAVVNINKHSRYSAYPSATAYSINKKLDTDKDGVACER
ncbi:excalibur calcium-binding domain-containing protein [Rhodoluna limnophila]|uniref:excalibur calcium-binding domain-containing protein n=1 Tax=Rhodoluna limnophila TaxID=232537 RepID=UPI0015626CC7|nr:excalibur calcium-binding domain-containing protein [Rhodoluna limnophila]